MNTSNLLYNGNVSIQLKIGNKIIDIKDHNNGTYYLKKVFAYMLSGTLITDQHTPQYLDLKYKTSALGSDWQTLLKQLVPLSKNNVQPVIDNEAINPFASFTATLAASLLTQTVEELNELDGIQLRFYLLSGPDENGITNELAYLGTDISKLEKLTPGTQAIITWKMQLLNESEVLS